jgi:hypothetical protein
MLPPVKKFASTYTTTLAAQLSQSSETLSAELTKETSIVCLHPLLDEASLIVKPKDVD